MMENMRARGRKILAQGLDETPDEYLEARGDDPEATLREWVEKHCPWVLDDLAVMALPKLVQSRLLNDAFFKDTTWATKRLSQSRFDLLISDKPLVYVGTFETRFLVGLPIAPKIAFLVFNDQGIRDKLFKKDDDAIVRDMNLSVVGQAERYVYATGVRQKSFVAKYLRK